MNEVETGTQWESTREPGRVVTILSIESQEFKDGAAVPKDFVVAQGVKTQRKSKISMRELTTRYRKISTDTESVQTCDA